MEFEGMQAYEASALTFDEQRLPIPTSSSLISVEEMVVMSLLRNIEFHDVLDAATGTGRYALRLAQMSKRVVGIDSSPQMLNQARTKAAELGLDVEFREASVLAIPASDSVFDLVTCALGLAHVRDLAGAVEELSRVLRRGGHLLLSDLHPDIQKHWGPDHKAYVYHGRLLMDAAEISRAKAVDPAFTAEEVPFPNYHGEVNEYIESLRLAGLELLAAIDVPMQQLRGLLPGALVVLARKRLS